jgi:hypothetical protein
MCASGGSGSDEQAERHAALARCVELELAGRWRCVEQTAEKVTQLCGWRDEDSSCVFLVDTIYFLIPCASRVLLFAALSASVSPIFGVARCDEHVHSRDASLRGSELTRRSRKPSSGM